MADRSRLILVVVLLAAAVLLLGYAAIVLLAVVRGDATAGPLRLLTMATNTVTGLLALGAAIHFWRTRPSGR